MLRKLQILSYLLLFYTTLNAQNTTLDSAIYYYEIGDFNTAILFLEKIDDSNSKDLHYQKQSWLAKAMGQKGLYTEANALIPDTISDKSIYAVNYYNAKGFLLQSQGYPNDAISELSKGYMVLSKFDESKDKISIEVDNLSLSAIAYWQLGSIEEASDYLKQALRLNENINNRIGVANCNINLGLIYSSTDSYKAQIYYEKALKDYQELYPDEKHPSIASIYINLGIIFQKNYFLDKAIASFEKAAGIWEQTYGSNHPNIAFAYLNIADAYLKSNQTELALEFYDFALSLYQGIFGDKHPEIANIYLKKGDIIFKQGKVKEALNLYQLALIANSKKFNNEDIYSFPSPEEYISPFTNIVALQKKATALEELHYTKTLKRKDLIVGIEGLKIAHKTIQLVRTTQKNKEDKIRLSAITNDIYSYGIELCLTLSDASINRNKWVKEAFNFVEWSKAASLLEAIQETNAKSFSGIPKELIEKENVLQDKIAYLEQEIINNKDREDLSKQLFDTQQSLDMYIEQLEKDYPKYFQLKFNQESISIDEIQTKLNNNEALISYFISDQKELVYIFIATKNKVSYFTEVFDDNVKDEIISLETGLKFNFDEIVLMSSNYLSPILFPFTLPEKINHITFLPDGQINNIPLDILLTDEINNENIEVKDYPFIVKKYAINYNFSATLAFTDEPKKDLTPSIACFAPIVFKDSTKKEVYSSLFGTQSEVREISDLFNTNGWVSKAYTYDDARKSFLKTDSIQSFSYIHFATHGLVDEEHPNQSYICMKDDQGNLGLLHAAEIYNLDLDVELVTLSACETGLGKISKGEGLIGLSRSLKYAGVDNSIVSLWAINDLSTSLFMQHFYKGIIQNKSIPVALQEAKIKFIQEGVYFSPYYWAAFTLIGQK